MTDKDLLAFIEQHLCNKMLEGCLIDDHLEEKKYAIGSWEVCLRADALSRLLDMARRKAK